MVTGAIAYDELQKTSPATIARVVAILRQHPQYESRWKPQMEGMSEQDQERYLFMLAARWPDDIRGDKAFDHPLWHYIDYPYKPPGQPDSVPAPASCRGEYCRGVSAERRGSAERSAGCREGRRAVLDLSSDGRFAPAPARGVSVHHAVPRRRSRRKPVLHPARFIESHDPEPACLLGQILLTDDRYEPARDLAAKLENSHASSGEFPKALPNRISKWTHESFDLAVSTVYRKGKLKISTDKNAGAPLPRNYHAAAERVATRRVALAGYRLADFLRTNFP